MAAKSRGRKSDHSKSGRRWSQNVTTVSTFPPEGTFAKDAQTIARTMASKEVSPKGIGSGIRMIQFFINRAGKNLPAERKAELEKAKHILQERKRREDAAGKRSKEKSSDAKASKRGSTSKSGSSAKS